MGMGKGGDGNKKGSGGGTELHTTVMAPCFYVGTGSTPGETKTGKTGRDREDKNRTEGLGSENDASRERMTQMSIAGGKRRRMARRGNRWHPETVSYTFVMTAEINMVENAVLCPLFDCLLLSTPAAACQPNGTAPACGDGATWA